MIMPTHVDFAIYIVDRSGIVGLITKAFRTSKRGRPMNTAAIRLFCIGMFLSIHSTHGATMTEIWETLSERLCRDDRIRLGVTDANGKFLVTEHQINYVSKTYQDKLAYGPSMETDGLTEAEADKQRAKRHATVCAINDALMDVFSLGWVVELYAIDATGFWSWYKGRKRPKLAKLIELLERDDEDCPAGFASWLETLTEDDWEDIPDGPDADVDDIEPTSTVSTGTTGTAGRKKSVNDNTDTEFVRDPDGTWAAKTSKTGGKERYFGYAAHSLIQSPKKGCDDIPALIRRTEVTTAAKDVVDVTLRMLTSMPDTITDIVIDRLYNYKRFDRWLSVLHTLGIRTHHDYQDAQAKFDTFDHMRWVAGRPHCPHVPDALNGFLRPGPNAKTADKKQFRMLSEIREQYAFQIHTQPDPTGKMRVRCPARNGSIGCPIVPGSVQTAVESGLPIINDPDGKFGAEGRPKCCTQETVVTVPHPKLAKHYQPHYWGTEKWAAIYDRRTYVEGYYGNIKNQSTENVCRGFTRGSGLAWMNLVAAMASASYNLRILRNWAERQLKLGRPVMDHPLLAKIHEPIGFDYVFSDESSD